MLLVVEQGVGVADDASARRIAGDLQLVALGCRDDDRTADQRALIDHGDAVDDQVFHAVRRNQLEGAGRGFTGVVIVGAIAVGRLAGTGRLAAADRQTLLVDHGVAVGFRGQVLEGDRIVLSGDGDGQLGVVAVAVLVGDAVFEAFVDRGLVIEIDDILVVLVDHVFVVAIRLDEECAILADDLAVGVEAVFFGGIDPFHAVGREPVGAAGIGDAVIAVLVGAETAVDSGDHVAGRRIVDAFLRRVDVVIGRRAVILELDDRAEVDCVALAVAVAIGDRDLQQQGAGVEQLRRRALIRVGRIVVEHRAILVNLDVAGLAVHADREHHRVGRLAVTVIGAAFDHAVADVVEADLEASRGVNKAGIRPVAGRQSRGVDRRALERRAVGAEDRCVAEQRIALDRREADIVRIGGLGLVVVVRRTADRLVQDQCRAGHERQMRRRTVILELDERAEVQRLRGDVVVTVDRGEDDLHDIGGDRLRRRLLIRVARVVMHDGAILVHLDVAADNGNRDDEFTAGLRVAFDHAAIQGEHHVLARLGVDQAGAAVIHLQLGNQLTAVGAEIRRHQEQRVDRDLGVADVVLVGGRRFLVVIVRRTADRLVEDNGAAAGLEDRQRRPIILDNDGAVAVLAVQRQVDAHMVAVLVGDHRGDVHQRTLAVLGKQRHCLVEIVRVYRVLDGAVLRHGQIPGIVDRQGQCDRAGLVCGIAAVADAADDQVALSEEENRPTRRGVDQVGCVAVEALAVGQGQRQLSLARAVRAIGRVRIALTVAQVNIDDRRSILDRVQAVVGLERRELRPRAVDIIAAEIVALGLIQDQEAVAALLVLGVLDLDLHQIGLRAVILELDDRAKVDLSGVAVAVAVGHLEHHVDQAGGDRFRRRGFIRVVRVVVIDRAVLMYLDVAGAGVDEDGHHHVGADLADDLVRAIQRELDLRAGLGVDQARLTRMHVEGELGLALAVRPEQRRGIEQILALDAGEANVRLVQRRLLVVVVRQTTDRLVEHERGTVLQAQARARTIILEDDGWTAVLAIAKGDAFDGGIAVRVGHLNGDVDQGNAFLAVEQGDGFIAGGIIRVLDRAVLRQIE